MSKPLLFSFWSWKGKDYRFDVYREPSFEKLTDVGQVCGIILNKEMTHVLVVNDRNEMWILPGGKVETNESTLETLLREVKEETNRELDLTSIQPAFHQICNIKEGEDWVRNRSEVRYIAVIEKDIPFEQDPDEGDITEAKWVSLKEFPTLVDWGEVSNLMIDIIKEYTEARP